MRGAPRAATPSGASPTISTGGTRRGRRHLPRIPILGVLAVAAVMVDAAYGQLPEAYLDAFAIIPTPAHIVPGAGRFQFGLATTVRVLPQGGRFRSVVSREIRRLRRSTGLDLPVVPWDGRQPGTRPSADIVVSLNTWIPPEGYWLLVDPDAVRIVAADPAGLFHAFQSIRQLLPPAIEDGRPHPRVAWRLPAVEILDYPRFPYRGLHLDVSRHFFDVDIVKRFIDVMARYKFNRFHWHLTDDQGWRIEIARYPLLTKIGAWRRETVVGRNFLPTSVTASPTAATIRSKRSATWWPTRRSAS